MEKNDEREMLPIKNNRVWLAAGSVILLLCLAVIITFKKSGINSYNQTAFVMGTVFQISIETTGEDPTPKLIEKGNELERNTLSWRIDDSEVARINSFAGNKDGYPLSEEMENILTKCFEISEYTDGDFDVTIGALTRLWDIDSWASGENGRDTEEFVPPSQEDIQRALKYCGYDKVRIHEHRIYLPEGMSLDLGSVGKGLYLDDCRRILEEDVQNKSSLREGRSEENAYQSGIISAGGSILTCGKKKGTDDWNVGITDPFDSSQLYGSITVSENMCVSTSGPYERFVEYNGVRYHHILDPKTGYPAESDLESVTIVSEDGLISDALSTACFVGGAEKASDYADHYEADIFMIDDVGNEKGTIIINY